MEVVLALGGGGVKCFAQLGVLEALEAQGVRVRAVAATSAGGLVGAGYAAGHSVPTLIDMLSAAQAQAVPFRARRGDALLDARAGHDVIERLVGRCTFAELELPLALTVVELASGTPRVLDCGPVAPALRAAIAVPGLFAPECAEGVRLIDGGAVDPVPVRAARSLAPGLPVLAVIVTPALADGARHPVTARLDALPVVRRLRRLRLVRAFEVFVRAADISHRALLESRLAIDRPEIVVRPRVLHLDLFGAVDVADVIREGRRAAHAVLSDRADQPGLDPRSFGSAAAAAAFSRATASATGTPAP
ncbi:MAG: patatin-like phospholipase family protein [Ardenticatenales bacterium]